MKVTALDLPEVRLIQPRFLEDSRGFFLETWSSARYSEHGLPARFVQDNLSRSHRGTLRGLHLQHPHGQGKLVYVLEGEVYDVAVDVRVGSPSFGRFCGATLSSLTKQQLYVPPGFAHGFCVLSDRALVAYKCTEPYHPECELGVRWSDPELGIDWRVERPTLSDKDARQPCLREIPVARLPRYTDSGE